MPTETDAVLPLILAHVELQTLVLSGSRSSHPFPPYTKEITRMTIPVAPVPAPVADHPAYTPGWKTSEFWLTLAMVAGGLLKTGFAPNSGAGMAGLVLSTAATAAYSASRAYTKANAPVSTQSSGYLMGSGRDGTPSA